MASFRPGGPHCAALALLVSATWGQVKILSEDDFSERSARLAMQIVPSTAQGLDFGQVSLSFLPGQYVASDGTLIFFGMAMPQMWVSTNLAIKGGLGFGSGGDYLVQMLRLSLVYLPATLAVRGWQPEIVMAQNRIDGLPEMTTVKWNEVRWRYKNLMGGWQISAGVTLLYQRIFTRSAFTIDGQSVKYERTVRLLNLSLGRRLFGRIAMTGHLALGNDANTAGFDMSVGL